MSFDSDRLSHAYIIDDSFASTLAMAVVCNARDESRPCKRCSSCDKASRNIHPDIAVIGKAVAGKIEDKLIVSVDQIRELKKDVYIVPNDSEKKAYIIYDADSMSTSAQNALLQVLEEPPSHAVFLLCSENPDALLQTVRSRCVDITSKRETESAGYVQKRSADSDDDDSEFEEFVHQFVSALAGDNVKLMECMFRLEKLDRLSFADFLTLSREKIILSLRECYGDGSQEFQEKLVTAESILIKAGEMLNLNVSTGHISGFICASLIE